MKIVIIGGGVSGLAAGIYAQRSGFDTVIYEKNPLLGGLCSYWKRKGFLLDNCVHWLTGTNKNAEINDIWHELNVLGPDVRIIQHQSFFHIEDGGQELTLWQDLERTRKELKILSPEDSEQIDQWADTVEKYKSVVLPTVAKEHMTVKYIVNMVWKMRSILFINGRYASMSLQEYAAKFKHPLLRRMCTDYFPDSYSAMTMFYTFATFCSGNGALPEGGSKGIVDRMEKLYHDLGGQVVASCEVSEIKIEGSRATGVVLEDGSFVEADWVIPACDTLETFKRLLPEHFIEPFFADKYRNTEKWRVTNSTMVYFGLDNKAGEIMPQNTEIFDCVTDVFGERTFHVVMKHFDYEPDFAPEGKSVIQCLIPMTEHDFDRLKDLYDNDRETYKALKATFGKKIQESIERKFPAMTDNLSLLDVATPVTHYRFCKSYKGSFMGFSMTPFVKKEGHNGRIKGLDNVVLSGQWIQMPGGLPIAATTGKFAIERVKRQIEKC